MRSIRIVNDSGISRKTKIFNCETGEEIVHVRGVEISPITVKDQLITAKVEYIFSTIDIKAYEIDKVFEIHKRSKIDKILLAPFYVKLAYDLLTTNGRIVDVTCLGDKYRSFELNKKSRLQSFKTAVNLYLNLFRV